MRILLTNDDGFFAPGIRTLYEVLSANNEHEVYIVAPAGQRSATGRAITIYQPLFVTEHSLKNNDYGLAVEGTPTDCIKLAIQGNILPHQPDLIISGINNGPNLGTDIFYSGTVAAAMEGALLGIPSLAVSLASYEFKDYLPAADFIKELIDQNNPILKCQDGLFNINFPGLKRQDWTGIRITKLGKSVYHNSFECRKAPYGCDYFWITGSLKSDNEDGSDFQAIQQGAVSLTPLHSDLSDYQRIKTLRDIQWGTLENFSS